MSAADTAPRPGNASEGTSWAAWVLNILFCGTIVLPLVGTLWRKPDDRDIARLENRNAVPLPEFPRTFQVWQQYPPKVEAFANDHFTFRQPLLDVHHHVKASLGISPSPLKAIGKDGWLFLRNNEEWNDVTGRAELSTLLKMRWLVHFNDLHERLKALDIPFIVVIAPDKSSIYPEHLPPYAAGGTRKQRLNDLLAFLKEHHCKANIVDLRQPLLSRKQDGQLYARLDTHWNYFGAAVAAETITQQLHGLGVPQPPPPAASADFDWTSHASRGDLSLVKSQVEYLPIPKNRADGHFRLEYESRELCALYPFLDGRPEFRITTHCKEGKGRLLMFRDSFGTHLIETLSRCFERADYLWLYPAEPYLNDGVQTLKPTVIIWELAERLVGSVSMHGLQYEPGILIPQFLTEELYTLTRKKVAHLRVTRGRGTLKPSIAGFTASSPGGALEIRLDRLPLLGKGMKAFQCTVDSPGASPFQLRDGAGNLLGESSLHPGRNDVTILLPEEEIACPLFMRLGKARGDYAFRRLVIRGVGRSPGSVTQQSVPPVVPSASRQ